MRSMWTACAGPETNCVTRTAPGVITPNTMPLTTIVAYQVTETTGPVYLHAVWYLPFTHSPWTPTVTYHFRDLQDVYSGNRQIHTKCQLSISGKCHCVIIVLFGASPPPNLTWQYCHLVRCNHQQNTCGAVDQGVLFTANWSWLQKG